MNLIKIPGLRVDYTQFMATITDLFAQADALIAERKPGEAARVAALAQKLVMLGAAGTPCE